jgi:rSAM/selenodomain-associated transferase 1
MTAAEAKLGLGLMCKPPRPGATKTRLGAGLGAIAAAQLSSAFLQDCAAVAADAARLCGLEPAAFYRPEDAGPELAGLLGPGWPVAYADAGELGATMRHVLGRLLARCPAGAMVMGADMPLIRRETLVAAACSLRAGDARSVTIIPTEDGGYCLIGVRCVQAAAPLFAPMAWSTPDVFDETVRRARDHGLTVTLLPPERDIDEAADLDWLKRELAAHPHAAPGTRAALAMLGRQAGALADG